MPDPTWLLTAASLVGVVLNIHHRRECFAIWGVTNAAWCAIDGSVSVSPATKPTWTDSSAHTTMKMKRTMKNLTQRLKEANMTTRAPQRIPASRRKYMPRMARLKKANPVDIADLARRIAIAPVTDSPRVHWGKRR